MTKLFLIRHAEAEGNIYRRAHGHFNGQLTKKGHKQVSLLRARFEGVGIDAIYSSDLARARVTATALSEPRRLPISTSEMLREVGFGRWEDMAWGNLELFEPEQYSYFVSDPARWGVNGSEAFESVVERMTRFIAEVAAKHDGGSIAVFSHGFAIKSFFVGLMGLESHESGKVKYSDNTAVALLHYEGDGFTIEYHGDNSHLSAENSTFASQRWWRAEKKWATENLYYLPLEEARDSALLEQFRLEMGWMPSVDEGYAAFRSDEQVGMVGIDSADGVGWISYLYVLPKFRRMGFGEQLLGQALSMSRKAGMGALRVKVPCGSPAASLCEKHGFVVAEETGGDCLMELGN